MTYEEILTEVSQWPIEKVRELMERLRAEHGLGPVNEVKIVDDETFKHAAKDVMERHSELMRKLSE